MSRYYDASEDRYRHPLEKAGTHQGSRAFVIPTAVPEEFLLVCANTEGTVTLKTNTARPENNAIHIVADVWLKGKQYAVGAYANTWAYVGGEERWLDVTVFSMMLLGGQRQASGKQKGAMAQHLAPLSKFLLAHFLPMTADISDAESFAHMQKLVSAKRDDAEYYQRHAKRRFDEAEALERESVKFDPSLTREQRSLAAQTWDGFEGSADDLREMLALTFEEMSA